MINSKLKFLLESTANWDSLRQSLINHLKNTLSFKFDYWLPQTKEIIIYVNKKESKYELVHDGIVSYDPNLVVSISPRGDFVEIQTKKHRALDDYLIRKIEYDVANLDDKKTEEFLLDKIKTMIGNVLTGETK